MSNEITKEEWFRYIDEAVRHKDWKRRLFGKQSNYRKDKRKYSDRCRDCKWKPMIADANGSVGVVKDERTTETCDAEQGACVEAAPMTISELNEFAIRKTYAAMDQTLDTLMKNEDIRTKVKIETLIQLLLVLKDCRCL